MIIQQLLESSGNEWEINCLQESVELLKEVGPQISKPDALARLQELLEKRLRSLQPTLKRYEPD